MTNCPNCNSTLCITNPNALESCDLAGWLNGEVKLVIENTEELYDQAIELTDYNPDNNPVSLLLAAVFRTIKANTGGEVDPYKIITSFPKAKTLVIEIAKELQEEARA